MMVNNKLGIFGSFVQKRIIENGVNCEINVEEDENLYILTANEKRLVISKDISLFQALEKATDFVKNLGNVDFTLGL